MCDKRAFQSVLRTDKPVTKEEAEQMIKEYNESVVTLNKVFYGDE